MKSSEFVPGVLFRIDYGYPDSATTPSKYWNTNSIFMLLSFSLHSEFESKIIHSLLGEFQFVSCGSTITRVKVTALGPEGDTVYFAGNAEMLLKVGTSTTDE